MVSATVTCYCGNQRATQSGPIATAPSPISAPQRKLPLCQPCATRRLSSQISRYHATKESHARKKEECHLRLLETRLLPSSNTTHTTAKNDDAQGFSSRQPLPDPSQINQRVSQLKQRLDMLRSQTNDVAVRVTAKTMENDEREKRLQSNCAKVELARERLDRMRQCLLVQSAPNSNLDETFNTTPEGGTHNNAQGGKDGGVVVGGGLKDALVSGTQQIQALRFRFACKVFDMHRLDVGEQYSKRGNPKEGNDSSNTKGNEGATGVGKIGSLPLPHAGPVLYGVIPPFVLASSLRLVASLTQLVARCLGVVLPHPILVCFREHPCGSVYDFGSDVIDVASAHDGRGDDGEYAGNSEHYLRSACQNDGMSEISPMAKRIQPTKSLSSSSAQSHRRSSLLSLVGSSARKAIAITTSATSRAITQIHHTSISEDTVPSGNVPSKSSPQNTHTVKPAPSEDPMSSDRLSRRIDLASFAHLRENDDKSATEYVLNPPRWREDGNHTNKNEANNSSSTDNANHNNAQKTDPHQGTKAQAFSTREEFHVAEERFATGMQLLQNDVAALCFRAGVDVSDLWPAESVLLNLHSLWCHCRKMADANSQ